MPPRTPLTCRVPGAEQLRHRRFYAKFMSWASCDLCGLQWLRSLKHERTPSILGDRLRDLPLLPTCSSRGSGWRRSKSLGGLLFPSAADVERPCATADIYLAPREDR